MLHGLRLHRCGLCGVGSAASTPRMSPFASVLHAASAPKRSGSVLPGGGFNKRLSLSLADACSTPSPQRRSSSRKYV